MVFGLDAIATTIDRWFDFFIFSIIVPILVFVFVGLFFLMQYYFIKGYIFIGEKGFKIVKMILDGYKLKKGNIFQKLIE